MYILLTEYENSLCDEMVLGPIDEKTFGRMRRDGVKFFTKKVEDEIVSLVTYSESNHPNVTHGKYAWVHPDYRGNGKAAEIVVDLVESEDLSPFIISVEPELQSYWEDAGFRRMGDNVFYL